MISERGSTVFGHSVCLEVVPAGWRGSEPRIGTVRFGVARTPLGRALLAESEGAICAVEFLEQEAGDILERSLARWPGVRLFRDDERAGQLAGIVFGEAASASGLRVLVCGTAFQEKVWRALLEIPHGQYTTYRAIAGRIGSPSACRAVGSAVGANPVAVLIPCHRVVASDGGLGGYRWGLERKRWLLDWEASRSMAA